MTNSPPALRVIQISDCHVSADAHASYRAQNADRNLARVVDTARRWVPDLLIVSGDVSEDGSRASYRRTSEILNTIGAPVAALPGNHDDVVLMREFFPDGPWAGPYAVEAAGWQVILLDSTEPGRISGSFSQRNLRQLQDLMLHSAASHRLLALHHQPVAVGAAWIDRYRLESPETFFAVTDRVAGVRCITWGHVHHDFRSRRNGVMLLGAPSSVANSLPATDRFTLDPAGPACRWLELSADGRLETGILLAASKAFRGVQSSAAGSTSHKMR